MIAKLPDLDEWKKYFLHNEGNIQKITWSDNHFLSKEEKECISSSIAKFQLGEYSEGKKLIDFCENYAQRYKDKTIKQITNLFIREEQAHSYILKRFMDSNNIATLERHWTDNLFRLIRSLAGYELSITVLITAEIIALTYYDALSKATQSKLLKNICLKIIDPWFLELDTDSKKEILKSFFSLLEDKKAAYDINHYPSAPPGIRIWGGGTIEKSNIELLLPWLDWAWEYIKK